MTHVVGYAAKAQTVTLLSNASATGAPQTWPGGEGKFHCAGTFSGCSVTLSFLADDRATYIPFGADTTLSAAGVGVFYGKEGDIIKAVIANGPPSGLYASATQL